MSANALSPDGSVYVRLAPFVFAPSHTKQENNDGGDGSDNSRSTYFYTEERLESSAKER